MRVDGQCHCGAIRFEAEVDPEKAFICHCVDCQQLIGTAFRVAVPSRPGTFRLLSGAPKLYFKIADSGARREQAFCPDCGTPIYSASAGEAPRAFILRIGTLRQRDSLNPKLQLWARSAQGWLSGLESIPRHDTQPIIGADGSIQ